jgi:hypothetical protein
MTTASGPRLLVTECLPRPDVRGPDPLAVIHLTSADPVSAVGEHGKKSVLIAPNRLSVPIDVPVIDAWLKPQKATGRSVRFIRRNVRPSICFRFSTETPP